MNVFSKSEIDALSKKELSGVVLQQSTEIALLHSTLKRMEKQLNFLYKELDGKTQIPLLPSENLSVLQKTLFGRSSEKRAGDDNSPLFGNSEENETTESEPKPNKNKGSSKAKRKKSEDKVSDFVPIVEHYHYADEKDVDTLGLTPWKGQFQTSDLISIIPARIQVNRHHQQKYIFTDPETGELILIGGEVYPPNGSSGEISQRSIYKLSDINGDWILQSKSLVAARADHSSMFVPDDQLPCETKKSKRDEL